MLFRSSHHKKANNPILGVFRLFLSLIIMVVLGLGLLQAYKAFSGYDPISLSPQQSLKSLLTSEGAYNFIVGLLTFDPKDSLNSAKSALQNGGDPTTTPENLPSNAEILYSFAVMADSHLDYQNLAKALAQAKGDGAQFIIGIGDLSDVGTIEELTKTKAVYAAADLPYYIAPGDHDMWDSRNQKKDASQNFMDVFGAPYQSFTYKNTRFILVNNADNYLGIDSTQLAWIEDELKNIDQTATQQIFVVADIPLFHPSSDHVMGKTEPKLKAQAEHLMSIFARAGVRQIFSADTHMYSSYKDPTNNLPMITVGAVTSDRNPQIPRFLMVDVREDGSYNTRQVEIQ
jgi:predicted phosphodiesterase